MWLIVDLVTGRSDGRSTSRIFELSDSVPKARRAKHPSGVKLLVDSMNCATPSSTQCKDCTTRTRERPCCIEWLALCRALYLPDWERAFSHGEKYDVQGGPAFPQVKSTPITWLHPPVPDYGGKQSRKVCMYYFSECRNGAANRLGEMADESGAGGLTFGSEVIRTLPTP